MLDDSLVEETDEMGMSPTTLGGIQIELYKCAESKLSISSDKDWSMRLQQHQAQLSAKAEKVDHESFHKSGITHRAG
ncbi:MAG: hypothetical protein CL912_08445 [Deltaproteobacteria bacterium]|nr:hypothetical protein [Deltaproteobacteria bacterium]